MDKWTHFLAVSAVFLTSVLLVRSNRPSICINSNIVQNISIEGAGRMLNCSDPDHALKAYDFTSQTMNYWEGKSFVSVLSRLNQLPIVVGPGLEIYLSSDDQVRNHGLVWQMSKDLFKQKRWLTKSLLEYWSDEFIGGLNLQQRLIYTELVLRVNFNEPLENSKYLDWSKHNYALKDYCTKDKAPFRVYVFCKPYLKQERNYFVDQAWGVEFLLAQMISDYIETLNRKKTRIFKRQIVALAGSAKFRESRLNLQATDSLLVKKHKIRNYSTELFAALGVAHTQKAFKKILIKYKLNQDLQLVSEK